MNKSVIIVSVLVSWIALQVGPANAGTIGIKQSVTDPLPVLSLLPQSGYFAWDVTPTIQLQIGLGYATASAEALDEGRTEDVGELSVFVPSAGVKVFSEIASRDSIVPYLFAGVSTLMISIDGPGLSNKERRIWEDDSSFFSVSSAVGVEYFLNDFFSVGGEFGVCAYFFELKDEASVDLISTYSTVTMNYRL
jgi:hypothetical protein